MAIPIDGIFSTERKALSKEGKRCQTEVPSSNTPTTGQVTKVKTTAICKAMGKGGCIESGNDASSCE